MTYSGRCACGAVTASIAAEPIAVRQCWCRQCQQLAGGGASTNAIFPAEAVTVSGELSTHSYVAASGNTIFHQFCGKCGTPVLGYSSARTHFRVFRVGFIDEPHGLKPQAAIWIDEAPDWAVIDPAIERFDRQPPPPQVPPRG